MKKIFSYLIPMLVLFLFFIPIYASADSDDGESIEEILPKIRAEQGISSDKNIDCDKVSDKEFEELGDAVMSIMHPDKKQHELMDNMMGGEGSKSLSSMHIMMGQRYLNCGDWRGGMMGGGIGMMGMMGGNMMGNLKSGTIKNGDNNWNNNMMGGFGNNMMGYAGFGSMLFNPILMIVFWVFVILGIVALIKWLLGLSSAKEEVSALNILKKRYAKGEITKKDFEEMKKEL